jgi:hypothetical protein
VLLEGEVVGDELPARLPVVANFDVADHRAALAAAGRSAGDRVAERDGQVGLRPLSGEAEGGAHGTGRVTLAAPGLIFHAGAERAVRGGLDGGRAEVITQQEEQPVAGGVAAAPHRQLLWIFHEYELL